MTTLSVETDPLVAVVDGDAGRPPLLEVRNVSKSFPVRLSPFKKGYVSAVDGLSFTVKHGTTVGIVGESGCGKSTAARLILGLIDIDNGDVLFEGRNVKAQRESPQTPDDRRELRRNMQMVFQDP
ncbi:MAG: ATP-binding cassette domain-containing protein, partial [Dehalococcoidia bacterium]|nr:ATP-binding cassette domain-containing protein [Dehalococcoidia bacterium]